MSNTQLDKRLEQFEADMGDFKNFMELHLIENSDLSDSITYKKLEYIYSILHLNNETFMLEFEQHINIM